MQEVFDQGESFLFVLGKKEWQKNSRKDFTIREDGEDAGLHMSRSAGRQTADYASDVTSTSA